MQRALLFCILLSVSAWALAQEKGAPDVKAVGKWADQLTDPSVPVRWYAAHALSQLGPKAAAAVPALQKVLENRGENEYVRGVAARALGCIGPAAESAVGLLAETSASQYHLSVRRSATWALGRIGPAAKPAIGPLLERLDDQDAVVRVNAAVSLWQIDRHPRAVPTLVEMARRREGAGAYQATIALGELGAKAEPAVSTLGELLRRGDDDVSRAAAASLARLGPEAMPALKGLLGSKEDSTRRRALETLQRLGPAAMPSLIDGLKDASPLVRKTAARAIGRLGPAAKDALPALLERISDRDEDEEVREVAAWARNELRADTGHKP